MSQLVDLEVILLATGVLMERHHLRYDDALFDVVTDAFDTDRSIAETARSILGRLGDGGDGPTDVPADDPRLARPEAMGTGAEHVGLESVELAIGVLAERHGQRLAEAAQRFSDQVTASGAARSAVADQLVRRTDRRSPRNPDSG